MSPQGAKIGPKLVQRLGMLLFLAREMIPQAASGVFAAVLSVVYRPFLFRGAMELNLPHAFRAAKLFILQAQGFFDRHQMPSEKASFSRAMPSFYFYLDHFGHNSSLLRLPVLVSRAAHGHFVELDGGHSYAYGNALPCFAAGADAFIEL